MIGKEYISNKTIIIGLSSLILISSICINPLSTQGERGNRYIPKRSISQHKHILQSKI